jgi:hypothetical protein
VTAKLNMADGVRGGISTEESLITAKWLEEDGGLDAIELTAGSSLVNPMYLFRGDAPLKEFAGAFKPPLSWGMRMTGKKFLREYPYREAYLLRDAKLFRAELTMPLILLGGITNRETMDLAMAEGFQFVAMARALLAEPDLINRIKRRRRRAQFGAVGVYALQQVHAHDLQPHPLRRDGLTGLAATQLEGWDRFSRSTIGRVLGFDSVECAFVGDAVCPVLGSGGRAAGHGQAGCVVGGCFGGAGGCGGCAEFGEQQSAAGGGGVGAAVGGGPVDGSVGVLAVSPAGPEGLQQVVCAAEASEVGGVGGAVGPGDGVVEVAGGGGHGAAREAAGQVAAADEVGQRRRWGVAGFWWGLAGVDDRHDRGAVGGAAGDRPGQQRSTDDHRGRDVDGPDGGGRWWCGGGRVGGW